MTANPTDTSAPESATPVSRQDLKDYFLQGAKPAGERRIGTEYEQFLYRLDDHGLLPHRAEGDAPSIEKVLRMLDDRFSWTPVLEEGNIIAVTKGKYSINVESGGQIELSGAAVGTLHCTDRELKRYLEDVRTLCKELRLGILSMGYHPLAQLPEKPVVLRTRFNALSGLGERYDTRWGRLTCAEQVNLDYMDEDNMIRMLRVSLALQPVVAALFANSPFVEGRNSGYRSYRYHLYTQTHSKQQRAFMEAAFDPAMSFDAYIDFAMKQPLLFVYREGRYHPIHDGTFEDFYEGRLAELPEERPTLQDWKTHLSTIYTDVRLRNYLEMRGADAGTWDQLLAQPALWTGLLYDDEALASAYNMIKGWSVDNMMNMRLAFAEGGLQSTFKNCGKRVGDLVAETLSWAHHGLRRRGILDEMRRDETTYLHPAMTHALLQRSNANIMTQELEDTYRGDLRELIRDYSIQ